MQFIRVSQILFKYLKKHGLLSHILAPQLYKGNVSITVLLIDISQKREKALQAGVTQNGAAHQNCTSAKRGGATSTVGWLIPLSGQEREFHVLLQWKSFLMPFLPSNRITISLLWYLWYKVEILKNRDTLISPASDPSRSKVWRALAMARMTPCMAGLSITYHKRAQNIKRKRRRQVQKKIAWKVGEKTAEGKHGSVASWPAATASQVSHPILIYTYSPWPSTHIHIYSL